VRDCHGLLNRCLVVDSDVKELRNHIRLRENHIRESSKSFNSNEYSIKVGIKSIAWSKWYGYN